jgi:hypothetical protein
MAFNRTRLLQVFSAKAVKTTLDVVQAGDESWDAEMVSQAKAETESRIDGAAEDWLDEIKAADKAEFVSSAKAQFKSLDADSAVKAKRQMSAWATRARIQAAWVIAEADGASEGACELYRKASSMRKSLDEIEANLSKLCRMAGLDMVRCETNDKGKLVKAKATPAPVLALEMLRRARSIVSKYEHASQGAKQTA